MRKTSIIFLGTVCNLSLLCAQNGNSVYGFLNFPASSHANALGGTNISIVERDLSVTSQNPALLGAEMSGQVALNYMHYLSGINMGGVQYARGISQRGAWSAGVQYTDYGKFTETSADNQLLGTFGAKDIAVNARVGYDIVSRIRGGVNAKFLYSAYESYSAVALAVDLGLNYYNEERDLSFSLVAKNLGGQLKAFDEQRESLPFDLQIGYSQSLAHAPFRFSLTAVNLTKWSEESVDNSNSESADTEKKSNFAKDLFRHIIIGVDYLPNDNFYVALGYNYKRRSEFDGGGGGFLTGFSGGAGIKIRKFDINASVARYHKAGTSLMVGVNLML